MINIIILIAISFICIIFSLVDPTLLFDKINHKYYLSFLVITCNSIFTFFCIAYILISFSNTKKQGLVKEQIILLPSTLIPILIIFLNCIPIFWSMLDKKFEIGMANIKYIEQTILFSLVSFTLLICGLILGKKHTLKSLRKKYIIDRNLDFTSTKKIKLYILCLIGISILSFFTSTGFRTDIILENGRSYNVDSELIKILIPLSGIVMSICTIFSGICYAKSGKKLALLVPVIDILPRLMYLSRGFYLPAILFMFSSSLIGKYLPTWIYLILFPAFMLLGSAALTSRGLSSGGITGIEAGINSSNGDFLTSTKEFLETSTNLGILSHGIAFHNKSLSFIDGFISWLITILPIPSFLHFSNTEPPSVSKLLGISSVGIPMPVIGELYFWMGWMGAIIYLFLGWWMGRLEGNIIHHTKIHGTAYWCHILLWLSLVYGFIYSFHSASRGSFRVLLYSLILIWLLELIMYFFNLKKKSNPYLTS
jgi:hypothetical protein